MTNGKRSQKGQRCRLKLRHLPKKESDEGRNDRITRLNEFRKEGWRSSCVETMSRKGGKKTHPFYPSQKGSRSTPTRTLISKTAFNVKTRTRSQDPIRKSWSPSVSINNTQHQTPVKYTSRNVTIDSHIPGTQSNSIYGYLNEHGNYGWRNAAGSLGNLVSA